MNDGTTDFSKDCNPHRSTASTELKDDGGDRRPRRKELLQETSSGSIQNTNNQDTLKTRKKNLLAKMLVKEYRKLYSLGSLDCCCIIDILLSIPKRG